MRYFTLLPILFIFNFSPSANSQSYLRVSDPDWWGAPSSNQPQWYNGYEHGKFSDVRIVATPKGVFTEIEVFANITHSPDFGGWWNDLEIIWQFDLPENTIVHDAWLWVGEEIIKADVVDFWTALETYTGIVDYNEDPLFFYQMSDKRYEVRVYPVQQGEYRRLKLSFLVPAKWGLETTRQAVLRDMFSGTDYPPDNFEIAVPVDSFWGVPSLRSDLFNYEMNTITTSGPGNLLHFAVIDADQFFEAEYLEIEFDAPYSGLEERAFTSIFSEGGDNFYQLVYVPDWEGLVQQEDAKKVLILLDYLPANSSMDMLTLSYHLNSVLKSHFTSADHFNLAVSTVSGIHFLSNDWQPFDDASFLTTLAGMINQIDGSDLGALISEGCDWAQASGDATGVYLLAASEQYFYPPVADAAFANVVAGLPSNMPFILFDYQDEDVSTIFYNNVSYEGNSYFYQLLDGSFDQFDQVVMRDMNNGFQQACSDAFPPFEFPHGTLDFIAYMENGVNYQEYNIAGTEVSGQQPGVISQVGKFVGNFPMHIQAGIVADDGQFWNINATVPFDNPVPGDSLMREMWYGPHLKHLEATINSNEDRQFIIETSKQERVLTGLTAFLALEPSLGGEPCVDCLFNNGEGVLIGIAEGFIADAELLVTPNPASNIATIQLKYPNGLPANDWVATIYDPTGKLVERLEPPTYQNEHLQWNWRIGLQHEGLYFVKIKSGLGEVTGKIIVVH